MSKGEFDIITIGVNTLTGSLKSKALDRFNKWYKEKGEKFINNLPAWIFLVPCVILSAAIYVIVEHLGYDPDKLDTFGKFMYYGTCVLVEMFCWLYVFSMKFIDKLPDKIKSLFRILSGFLPTNQLLQSQAIIYVILALAALMFHLFTTIKSERIKNCIFGLYSLCCSGIILAGFYQAWRHNEFLKFLRFLLWYDLVGCTVTMTIYGTVERTSWLLQKCFKLRLFWAVYIACYGLSFLVTMVIWYIQQNILFADIIKTNVFGMIGLYIFVYFICES